MWCEFCRKRFKKTDKHYKREKYALIFSSPHGEYIHLDMAEEVFCSKYCALEYWDETNIKEVNGEVDHDKR